MTVSLSRGGGAGGALRRRDGADADGLGPEWKFWRRRRYVLALLAFFGFAVSMVMRVNMALAIVDMTSNKTTMVDGNETVIEAEFSWDSRESGMVLSAFFYGYVATTLPGGWLAGRHGGKWVFGLGMLGTSAFTLLTPPLAPLGLNAVLALRVLVGLCEGVTWPSMHQLWARWAPPAERARLANFALTGLSLGPVVGMAACGALAAAAGWQATFYVTGVTGALWFIFWMLIVRDSPELDPFITSQEKKFIEDALGSGKPQAAGARRPWGRILRSPPVWAVAVAHFCEGWGYTTFLTQLPTFMTDALAFKLAKSGMLSALPYVAMIVSLPSVSVLSDWLVAHRFLTVTQARKTFNCVAFVAQTVFLFLTTVVDSPYAVVACMTIAQGIGAFACCGFSVNPLDLAPQHASVIMGLSCTVSTLSGMISPLLTGFIVTNKTREEWNRVFYVASGVYLFGAIFYFLFASGERQSWANDAAGAGAGAEAEAGPESAPLKA